MHKIPKNIGREIQYYRKKAGYTQNDLAKKIGKACRTIQKYETGDIEVSLSTLTVISETLRVPIDTFMGNRQYVDVHEVSLENTIYEIELEEDQVKIFRQIEENEYLKWYIDNPNISRRGKIRRLFLMEIPIEKVKAFIVRAALYPSQLL